MNLRILFAKAFMFIKDWPRIVLFVKYELCIKLIVGILFFCLRLAIKKLFQDRIGFKNTDSEWILRIKKRKRPRKAKKKKK